MVMVADAVGVSLIGCFVTPFISKSIKAAHKYIEEENKSLKNVNPKLKELAGHLDGIRVTVDKVGLCFIKNGTGEAVEHLWRLKGAIYEAEEILDLYESLKNNRLSCEFAQQFTGTKDSPSRLEEVVEKLGRLGLSTRELLQNSHNIVHGSPIIHRGPTQSQANSGNGFFGYVEERRQLQNLLRGEQNKVISITGHGGMGKTRLARQVFDANEPGFEVRIWAHVCNKLDQIELLTEICRSPINKSGDPMIHGPIMETVAALESVVEGLSKSSWLSKRTKTCLVVLDDVWEHEDGFAGSTGISRAQRNEAWASVLAMLRGLKSCKVVMTTRDKVCSTTLKADETIVLDGISQEPMEELLKHIAKSDNPPQGLAQRIGKLKGSPRAALSIVQELKIANSKTEEKIILDELDHKNHIQGLYADHLFTYHNLPLHLQSCLAFCSVFPYNWRFHPEKLTRMWIAHGFIDDTQVKQHKLAMEGVAKGYFKDLVDRSLFKIDTDGRYVIHVHIHSMIRGVSGDDCMSISNSSSSEIMVPATVCHLSVTAGCLAKLKPGPPLEKTRQAVKSNGKPEDEFRTVRTLIVLTDKGAPSSPWSDIREANSTLRKFKRVKVLDLTDTAITQVPDGVSELTHLRYLGVPHTVRHRPAHFTNLLLFYIDHEATKTAPLMQSAAPLHNPGAGGAGKAPLPNPGGGGLHNPGGGGAGKAPLQYNPGGGGGAGKTPLQYNPGGGGPAKAPLHNPGGGGAGKAPLHNPGGGGPAKEPLHNHGGGGAGKAPLHNPGGGGADKLPLHNPGGGGAGKAPLHNPGAGGAGNAPLHNPVGGGAGKAPLHNPGGGGEGKAPLHNPGGGGAGKAPLHNPGGGGAGKAPLHNPGGGGAGKAPLHNPVGGGAGKAPLHNIPGGGGAGKAPLHNPGGGRAGKAPLHNIPGGGRAGKAPLHNPGGDGAGKAPLHNPGGGGAGKAPLHNPGGGGAGKAPLHNPGRGLAGKAPLHNTGGGGAGKAPLHNPGGGGAGKAALHNPGAGGTGKAPLHNPVGGGAGKAPLHNPGGGGAGKAPLHNPGGGRTGKAPLPCNFKSI